MLTIFGAVAELEREYILQRQREGIAIAKQRANIEAESVLNCRTLIKWYPNGEEVK